MKVKSRFDADEEQVSQPSQQYMRGGCGAPYNLGMGPGRLDVSELRSPRFFEMVFKALGWKTRTRRVSSCGR
jgi:hypothetical protein